MGIYDRDYYQEEPRGLFLGAPRTMVTNLVIINVLIFLADLLLTQGSDGGPLGKALALKADLFEHPAQAWQLLTYGFVHSSTRVFHVVMNMLMLWMFGREMEMHYGPRRFLSLYMTLLIVSGLAWVAFQHFVLRSTANQLAIGASGAVAGIAVLFCFHYPTRIIWVFGWIPLPVWLCVGVYLLQDIVGMKMQAAAANGDLFAVAAPIAYAAHVGGAAFGAIFYWTRWSLVDLVPRRFSINVSALKSRPKLRVHRGGDDEDGPDERKNRDFERRMDEILEKLHAAGMDSLSREEQRFLEEASRRYQAKRR